MTIKENITARFSTRTKTLLFSLLVVLVLILHYPMSFNEIGWDSFAIHIIANSLSEFGYAKWWLHPLSVFGMYPYSMSSAFPFLLSSSSQLTGMSGDLNIFWSSLLLGIFSIFTAYLMAGVMFDNDIYKFLVALGYSTSQGILFYTTWTAGTRALFIVLLPLFIYSLIKSSESIKYVLVTSVLLLVLMSTHKMYYFLLPVIFSFVVVNIGYKLNLFHRLTKKYYLANLLFLFCLLFMFTIPFITRTFIETASRYEWLYLIFLSFGRYAGIAVIFMLGGYAYILLSNTKSKEEYFLLTSLIFLAPLMYIITYMKWFILPFIFLLAGKGMWNVLRAKQTLRVVPLLIIFIVIFSAYFQYIHFEADESSKITGLDQPLYVTATWSKDHIPHDSKMIGLYGTTGERFFAISEVPTMIGVSTVDLTYGFVNKSEINITRIPLSSFETFFESPFVSTNKPHTDWFFDNTFIYRDIDEKGGRSVINFFNLSYLLESPTRTTAFLSSVREKKDCYYDNGDFRVWDL